MADIGYEPNDPVIQVNNRIQALSDSAVDFSVKQSAIVHRIRDLMSEFQITQEISTNEHNSHRPVTFEVGEYVLLNREAYYTGGKYWKIQPLYVGPFKIVKKINENAFELDLPFTRKLHRVINKFWFKKLNLRKDQYPKDPPKTELELIPRIKEITSFVGYSEDDKVYYCTFEDTDPQQIVSVPQQLIIQEMSLERRQSLLNNFSQLAKQSNEANDSERANPRGKGM